MFGDILLGATVFAGIPVGTRRVIGDLQFVVRPGVRWKITEVPS